VKQWTRWVGVLFTKFVCKQNKTRGVGSFFFFSGPTRPPTPEGISTPIHQAKVGPRGFGLASGGGGGRLEIEKNRCESRPMGFGCEGFGGPWGARSLGGERDPLQGGRRGGGGGGDSPGKAAWGGPRPGSGGRARHFRPPKEKTKTRIGFPVDGGAQPKAFPEKENLVRWRQGEAPEPGPPGGRGEKTGKAGPTFSRTSNFPRKRGGIPASRHGGKNKKPGGGGTGPKGA